MVGCLDFISIINPLLGLSLRLGRFYSELILQVGNKCGKILAHLPVNNILVSKVWTEIEMMLPSSFYTMSCSVWPLHEYLTILIINTWLLASDHTSFNWSCKMVKYFPCVQWIYLFTVSPLYPGMGWVRKGLFSKENNNK